ncbi:peptidyl-tRNA hydrolase [Spiroplasma clarkii]|uniref:Peptidyl-tRNA hydrolase n=1 Tax=Spiroplasma clarkii TaxID=2139 RepID=A0A1Y0KZI2_9MOLU|nr:aminoacyl-tRNA hydrolase [Spiroplasma clarkii]ARU90878.1 peptidyl-tRNA hydrolase [Spiroplasma clarkii]ATX71667.1 peptidyl-tRNA hydrolase [Spiroplasma clarkii]
MPKLIVGLGNPGKQYEQTRHNAGFIALDTLMDSFAISSQKTAFKAELYFANIKGEKVIFAKPQTYMNLSGEAVLQILAFYKIPISDLVIIYDDKDLPMGKLRFRESGSAGGHNGMKSIIHVLGTQDFKRLRIGVDMPPEHFKIVDWVLSKMSAAEITEIKANINQVKGFVDDFCQNLDFKKIMNNYNK